MLRRIITSIAAGLLSGGLFILISSLLGSSVESSTSAATKLFVIVTIATFALITLRSRK
ncbi:hypothetical protein [Ruegeria sp. ANG-R]|uniref:hypothetical protein n=1 Tax=Ruegeria sp. ANG-R TaxID=1577903 RepID=UPI000AFADDC0|nr:hypothetical protein [Ruegeria sp. ANG-R]